jgi:flavin reductase (DIM6/NTAB) family NADH-FMN oxidoreductase RutF
MNASSESFPREIDEFTRAGLEKAECETIACTRIKGAPAAMECRLVEIVRLPGKANYVCIGEITGIHLRDDCLVNGKFDITTFRPLARLGYRDYTVVREAFSLARPDEK